MSEPTPHDVRLKLDRRIHNQRVALRNNWQIKEQRARSMQNINVRSQYLEITLKLYQEMAELRRKMVENAGLNPDEYRIVRFVEEPAALSHPTGEGK